MLTWMLELVREGVDEEDGITQDVKESPMEVPSKVATQLEAAIKGKKIRSCISLSAAEVFAKWDKGLCEWCDEPYFPGHKCKKIGPNTLFVVVAEEEDTMQPDFGVENPPAVDAPQVFDESPKSNPDISSGGWVGEGQGKLPVGSQNAFGEQLDGLNPSNGLLGKSNSSIPDNSTFNAQGKQQGNAQPSPDENSDLRVQKEISENANSEMCMDKELHMQAENSKALDVKSLFEEQTTVVPEQKEIPICPEMQDEYSQLIESYNGQMMDSALDGLMPLFKGGKKCRWHATKEAYAQVTLQLLSSPEQRDISLPADWYHGWKEVNGFCLLVFDRGKSGAGQGTPKPTSLAFMYAWLGEICAASKLSVVRLVFDPGEKIFTCQGKAFPDEVAFIPYITAADLKSYSKVGFSGDDEWLWDGKNPSSIWGWKPFKALSHIGQRKFTCCFFCHVHCIANLPLGLDGIRTSVHWKRKDNVLRTSPSRVSNGLVENLAASRLPAVRFVFDPGDTAEESTALDVEKIHPQEAATDADNNGVEESAQVDSKEVLSAVGKGTESGLGFLLLEPHARHAVAMATGVIDQAYKQGQPWKQVLVVVLSGWSVMCFDHNLKKLWEVNLQDDFPHNARYREVAISVSKYTIKHGDTGLVIVGGRMGLQPQIHLDPFEEITMANKNADEHRGSARFSFAPLISDEPAGSATAPSNNNVIGAVCNDGSSTWVKMLTCLPHGHIKAALLPLSRVLEMTLMILLLDQPKQLLLQYQIMLAAGPVATPTVLGEVPDADEEGLLAAFALSVVRLVFDPGGIAVDTHALQLNSSEEGNEMDGEKIHPQRATDADMAEQGQLAAEPVAILAWYSALQKTLPDAEKLEKEFLICPFTICCTLQSICCTKEGVFFMGGGNLIQEKRLRVTCMSRASES